MLQLKDVLGDGSLTHSIILDFKGVVSVEQAFVDEVFRVFKNEYPNITIHYVGANDEVDSMIKRGLLK